MSDITIEAASLSYISDFAEYVQECFDAGVDYYLDALVQPASYLQKMMRHSKGQKKSDPKVTTTTLFARDGDRVLGTIRLRQGQDETFEQTFGSIGYETRPSERQKGVAKLLLAHVQKHHLKEPAWLTCEDDNVAAIRVIESVEHEFEGTFTDDRNGNLMRRYQILPTTTLN